MVSSVLDLVGWNVRNSDLSNARLLEPAAGGGRIRSCKRPNALSEYFRRTGIEPRAKAPQTKDRGVRALWKCVEGRPPPGGPEPMVSMGVHRSTAKGVRQSVDTDGRLSLERQDIRELHACGGQPALRTLEQGADATPSGV